MSFLTKEYEALLHLMARAFARTHGQVESAETYAGTVVEHAKAIAEEDAAKVNEVVEPAPEPQATELPPGDQAPAA